MCINATTDYQQVIKLFENLAPPLAIVSLTPTFGIGSMHMVTGPANLELYTNNNDTIVTIYSNSSFTYSNGALLNITYVEQIEIDGTLCLNTIFLVIQILEDIPPNCTIQCMLPCSIGDPVVDFLCNSTDHPQLGNLTYSITDSRYKINKINNEIVITQPITAGNYSILLTACSGGVIPKCANYSITFTLPRLLYFPNETYRITVDDILQEGMLLPDGGLVCTEHPMCDNSMETVQYNISTNIGLFSVFENGSIYVINRIDYSTNNRYNLSIKCNKSLSEDSVIVSISNRRFEFLNATYFKVLPENVSSGEVFLNVTLRWYPTLTNVTYSISDSLFNIDSTGGVSVTSMRLLDFETTKNLNVTVNATALYAKATTTIIISVTDINDNHPDFDTTSMLEKTISIAEPPSSIVLNISATDNDTGVNQELTYTIDHNDVVDIYSNNGSVYVNTSTLECYAGMYYVLSVTATDSGAPPLSGTVNIAIQIEPLNILFNASSFAFNITENAAISTVIGHLNASVYTVAGVNTGKRQFYSVSSDYFYIDSASSILYVSSSIDRELISSHNFSVMASPQCPNGVTTMNQSQVSIFVTDENDNRPVFNMSFTNLTIDQDVTLGSILYSAIAVDSEDIGRNSQISKYYINRSFNNLFSIDSISGNISLTAIPTEYRDYLFDVFAEDDGIPSLTSYPLSISVSGLIRSEPQNVQFKKDLYIFSVAENTAISSSIGKIKLVYNRNPGTVLLTCFNCENFTINSTSMEIYTKVSFDREQQSSYAFSITASVGDFEIAQTTVSVIVTDINDNNPMFSHSSYTRAIGTDTNIGTLVLKVSATDNDINENSDISYSLYPNNTGFGINMDGSIVTRYNQLESDSHNFYVVATDKGINPQLSSSALVRITVFDDQTNFPFNSSSNQFSVEENSTTVGSIYASPNFTYELVHTSNDTRNCFSLTNGTISITCETDREMVDFYYFQIKATSDNVTSFANVMVTITDLNDSPPIFEHSTYSTAISNSLPANTIITTFKATDFDLNSTIHYYHNGPETYFKVNQSTGELTFNETNIGSLRGLYSSSIVATDGMLNSTVNYTIFIPSFNEEPLEFDQSQYIFNLTENSDILTKLGTLVLNYKNNPINEQNLIAPLSFEITDVTTNKSSGLDFYIDQAGELLTLTKIDREVQDFYNFTVTGYYGNTFKLTAETSVLITIQDINDVVPRFNQNVYFLEVNNTINNGDTLLKVNASDNDYQESGTIVYAIRDSVYLPSNRADVNNNLTTEFAINETSGVISLQSFYHPSGQYRLTVAASDRSTVPLTSTALVLINLFDAIPPNISFTTQNYYTFSVAENVSLLTHIGNVSVKEMNNPALQGIHYSITGGNGSDTFFIDPFSGVIVNAVFLDRETNPDYIVYVTATAVGVLDIEPSTIGVFISLEDVNDEVPSFSKQVYNVSRSSTESNSTIVNTMATDKDVGDNAKLTYTIVSGGNSSFTIDNATGVVYANGTNIPAGVYPLRVSVTDRGLMPLTSMALVLVTIYHIPPATISFAQPQYVFNITENSQLLTIVGNVSIQEMDRPGINSIKYTITDGNGSEAFVISSTGSISNIVITDRETVSSYTLTIEAAVINVPHIQAQYTNVLINVIDVNDKVPVFNQSIYRVNFDRNVTASVTVITLSAYDADIGSNARITYSILNNNHLFQINNMTGEIHTTASLILESSYILRVDAIDQGIPPNTGTTTVSVSITLPNITGLDFPQVSYTFDVSENASLGTYLGSVTLSRHHGFAIENVMYSINSTVFVMDFNGDLYTRQELDHENTSQYSIMMIAVLHVNNANLTASTVIMVNVTDVNDNAPVFNNLPNTTAVNEGLGNGTEVFQVKASDADSGDFGTLIFSVTDEYFSITQTGMVFVKGVIDRERKDLHKLLITVEDGGGSKKNALLTINIQDINDSPPVLLTSNEECFVYERTENSSACSLIFTDRDLGENGSVRVTNISGEGFRYDTRPDNVHPNIFTLIILSPLDYETTSSTNITVQFEDEGAMPNSNNKSLIIQVIDEPDNAPMFVNGSSQQVDVRTIVTNGSRIFTILATDADNDDIMYHIVKVNPVNVFERFYITPSTGVVLIVAPDPPFISNSTVALTISATDNSIYNLSSQSNVSISIIPNTLSFTELNYEFSLVEGMSTGTTVGTIRIDRDSQATDIELRIVPSNVPFDVTANGDANDRVLTGTIRTSEVIDRDMEQNNQYIFSVIAQRSAVSETATATVVINIQDINDNDPTYTGTTQLSVNENAGSSIPIATISATDPDLGENGRISRYTLLNNNQNFIINNQGVLQSNAVFDYEITQSYDITIEISDGGQPTKTARYNFTVNIVNLNDNPPMINHTMYFADIKEGEGVGHILLNVIIEDRDSDPYSIRQPPLVTGSAPLRLFVDDRNRVGSSYPIVLSFISSAPDSAVYSFNLQATDGDTVASATLYVGVFKQIHFFQFVVDDIPEVDAIAARIIDLIEISLFTVYAGRSSGLNVYLYSIESTSDGRETM